MATGTLEEGWGREFSPERAMTWTQRFLLDNGDISLPVYIAGIHEMYKLCAHRLFSSPEMQGIQSEVYGKVTILRELCRGEAKEHYRTVQSMVDYEIQHQLVEREDKPSGTVTLLRIHRMTEFACAGLDKVIDSAIPDKALSAEIVKAYTETLGRFHPQLMVVSIQWALLQVLPSRRALIAGIGLDVEKMAESLQWVTSINQGLRRCYDAVQKVYADRGLLNLSQGSL